MDEQPVTRTSFSLGKVLKVGLVLSLFPLGVVAGVSMTGLPFGTNTTDMSETLRLIKSEHVGDPVSDDALYFGAVSGMIDAMGDPFSSFLDPQTAQRVQQDMSGSFAGIGAEIGQKNGYPVIIAPMNDYPAAKAGVLAGDVITAVDDMKTYGKNPYDVIAKIRGEKGKPVTLHLRREGVPNDVVITVVRDTVKVESVKWHPVASGDKTVLVVTVSGFHQDTAALFEKAADEALASHVNGIVLDLRNDPGGYVSAAKSVSCNWLPTGSPYLLVQTKGAAKEPKSCDGTPRLANLPTVVLVNKGSASASEITAGALQDTGTVKVIGEKTFGKGCGQSVHQFADGAQLNLTSFLWFTPKGRSINKVGIAPDIVVESSSPEDRKNGKDAQLERALQFLTDGH